MTSLLDLRTPNDHALMVMLCFLPHNDGMARFARTARRARAIHAHLIAPGFVDWTLRLHLEQRRWVAGLAVAPAIRVGFEAGAAVSLRTVGRTDDVIKRLMACDDIHTGPHHLYAFMARYAGLAYGALNATRDVVVFLALGLLTDARIEELLEANLSKVRWAAVFARATNGAVEPALLVRRMEEGHHHRSARDDGGGEASWNASAGGLRRAQSRP